MRDRACLQVHRLIRRYRVQSVAGEIITTDDPKVQAEGEKERFGLEGAALALARARAEVRHRLPFKQKAVEHALWAQRCTRRRGMRWHRSASVGVEAGWPLHVMVNDALLFRKIPHSMPKAYGDSATTSVLTPAKTQAMLSDRPRGVGRARWSST